MTLHPIISGKDATVKACPERAKRVERDESLPVFREDMIRDVSTSLDMTTGEASKHNDVVNTFAFLHRRDLFRSKASANFFDTPLKFSEMGAGPIDLSAAGAAAEIVIVDFCERFQSLYHGVLLDFLQHRIATETPGKWLD